MEGSLDPYKSIMRNFIHYLSRFIINSCADNKIGKVVIEKWREET